MRRSVVLILVVAGLVVEGCGGSLRGGAGGAGGAPGNGGTGGKAGAGGAAGGGSAGQGAGGARLDASVDALATCGTSNSPSSGTSCNAIEASGPCVTETVGTGAPPAAAGGTIVAGTYDLVTSTVYPIADAGAGADAAVRVDQGPRRQTFVVSGSGTTLTYEAGSISGTEVQRLDGTMALSGSGLTLTPTCPLDDGGGNVSATLPYTATTSSTETRLIIYDTLNFDHLRLDEYLKR
jgi:hypothetical protein